MNRLLFILFLSFSFTSTLLVPDEFPTIQEAIDYSINGDTILVEPNIYYVDLDINEKNITITSRFIFSNDQNDIEETILYHNGESGAGGVFRIEYSDVNLRGLTIEGSDDDNVNIAGGILSLSSNTNVENCVIKNHSVSDSGAAIASIYPGSLTVKNSLIYDNEALFIGGIYSTYDVNILILNSTITNNISALGYDTGGDYHCGGVLCWDCESSIIVNSIITDNYPNDLSFWFNDSVDNFVLSNSIINSPINHYDSSPNIFLYDNLLGDPLFENDSNYRLSIDSPCIDTGINYFEWNGDIILDMNIDDYIGSAPDMGLFEFSYGDLNNDGEVNIFDIIILVNLVFNSEYNESGDINGDGILNITDCILLVNLILDN
tara:strand:+ start:1763 stop:2890 length:1128 start_codon:yes stop_codon:yes gene_type:complete